MRKLAAAFAVMVVLCGCQVPSEIRTADQARERANYLKAQSAAFQKEAAAADTVAENLREDVRKERVYMREYQEQARDAERRLARLEAQAPESEGQSRAIEARIDSVKSRLEAMKVKAGERREAIRRIELAISQQERHARSCRSRAEEILQEAMQVMRRAERLADKEAAK